MQKSTVCKCKIAMSQCHSVSSLDSVPHCWRVSCNGSEVVAPSFFTTAKLSPVFLLLGMHPKIYRVYPKLIPKRGVGQFCPRLLLPASTPSTAKMSPMCPSGGDQHYKASGPLSMLYQCQYGWVRESTAAIVMIRPYATTMSTRWSQLQSKVVAPELLLSLSSSYCPSGDLQGQPSLLFARMRLLCQPLLLVRIDCVIAIKDEIFV